MVACLASDILELMLGKPMRFLATNKNSQKSIIVRGLNAVQPWALEIIREKGSQKRRRISTTRNHAAKLDTIKEMLR